MWDTRPDGTRGAWADGPYCCSHGGNLATPRCFWGLGFRPRV